MKKKLLVLLLGGLVLITGCSKEPALENGKEVEVALDGYNITADDFYSELKTKYGTSLLVTLVDKYITSKEQATTDEVVSYAESQITSLKSVYGSSFSSILSQYGYASEDDLKAEIMESYKEELVAKKYIAEALSDDEINTYYEENIFGDITAKHILISSTATDSMSDEEKAAAKTEAYNTAVEVIDKLNNGEAWADLVKEYSSDTATVDNEGLVSDFNTGDVVSSFFEAANALNDNEYTKEPVESTYGYHIILKVSQKERPTLEDSLSTIKDALVSAKVKADDNLIDETWVSIRTHYNMTIYDTDINEKYNTNVANIGQ